jgi:hypothetical protein
VRSFKIGEEYQTKSGKLAKIYNMKGRHPLPLLGAIELERGEWAQASWGLDGVSDVWDGFSLKPKKHQLFRSSAGAIWDLDMSERPVGVPGKIYEEVDE